MPEIARNRTRGAAEIIEAARSRHVPPLSVAEAARRAGISTEGWRKVLRTGRGRKGTLLAMARITGTEAEVREALGLPPVRHGASPPLPPMTARNAARSSPTSR